MPKSDYQDYIYNFNSKEGKINKVGTLIGNEQNISIPEDDWEINDFGWADINAVYEQHSIDNVFLALQKDKKVGLETF